jgi:hypothetical protein
MKPLEIAQGRARSQVKKKTTKGKTTFDSDEEQDWPNAQKDKHCIQRPTSPNGHSQTRSGS